MTIDKNMMVEYNFVGTGIAFRPGYGMGVNGQGGLALMRGDADIAKSIFIILSTAPGERVMRPEFGCGIHDFVFASPGPELYGQIAYRIEMALGRWEPRIDIVEIKTQPDPLTPERLMIDILYKVRATNSERNLVYPFYIIPRGGE